MRRNPHHVGPAALLAVAAATAGCFPDDGRAASTAADRDAPPPPAWNLDGRFSVAFSTLLGTPGDDQLREAIPLEDGTAWIAGQANGEGMPTTPGVLQPRYAGEDLSKRKGDGRLGGDVWLGRLAADGSRVLAGTYFGGSRQERNAYGLERTQDGDVVFCTMTRSHDVKTTAGAFQPRFGGGEGDWCVARVSPDLKSLRWCTYVGGSAGEFPRAGLALDAEDRPVIVGYTKSSDFPTTEGAFQRGAAGGDDVAVVKLSADGKRLVAATRVGGRGDDEVAGVRLAPDGAVLFAGQTASDDFPTSEASPQKRHGGRFDATLVRLSADLKTLETGAYLGGRADEFAEHRLLLAADGGAWVTGSTASPDFPATENAWQKSCGGGNDGFVVRYAPDLRTVVFATCVGRAGEENLLTPALDADGVLWCAGYTSSPDFPVTPDALQPKYGGGKLDGLIVALSADGSRLVYASFLGGAGDDHVRGFAVAPDGAFWLLGNTDSRNFPTSKSALRKTLAGGMDAFVVKLTPKAR